MRNLTGLSSIMFYHSHNILKQHRNSYKMNKHIKPRCQARKKD